MKINSINKYAIPGIAALGLLLSGGVEAGKKNEVKLTGQNDALVDRQAIQGAIDSAPGEDLTVKLRGTFQLDGHDIIVARSNLIIKADRRGATLQGKLGIDGMPIDDIDNFPNRGFVVESPDPLNNLEFKDLTLTGLRSPIFLRGISNSIHTVSVKNNSVDNSIFGVVVVGQVSDVRISENEITGVSGVGVNVFSLASPGEVSDIRIDNNEIYDAGDDAIVIGDVTGVTIHNNYLSTSEVINFPAPLFVYGVNTEVVVNGNTIEGGFAAVLLLDDSTDFTITENCIRNGGTQGLESFRYGGILLGEFGNASGFEIMNNTYEDNFAGLIPVPRDVWLSWGSSNNSVLERNGTAVLDQGASNSVAFFDDDGVDHCND